MPNYRVQLITEVTEIIVEADSAEDILACVTRSDDTNAAYAMPADFDYAAVVGTTDEEPQFVIRPEEHWEKVKPKHTNNDW